jgi:hypothetical protein
MKLAYRSRHNPFGRSLLLQRPRLELVSDGLEVGKALRTAGHVRLDLCEGHADWPSFEDVRQFFRDGMGRFLLFGAREERPKQSGIAEAVLTHGAGSQVTGHDRIPEHTVSKLRDLFVGEMDTRHRTTLLRRRPPPSDSYTAADAAPPQFAKSSRKFCRRH